MNEEDTENNDYEIAIIGAGGIGSNLAPMLIQALHRGALVEAVGIVNIRIYDGDRVEESNLSHQRFTPSDVGKYKVEAIEEAMKPFESERLRIHACPWNVRSLDDDMTPADLIVVAVDSPQARRTVHDSEGIWLDCRCRGESTITIDFRVDPKMVDDLTPGDQQPASCQLPGALESGNIQFGFMAAATHAAQWVMQCLRYILGEERALPPPPQARSLTMGTLSFLPMKVEPPKEPRDSTRPHKHADEVIDYCIGSGEHDSAPIRETIAAMAMDGEHQQVWDISDRMDREVSVLIDDEGLVWVDVGESGEVQLSPPEGSRLPYRSWWHTHPRSSEDPYDDSDCYWSSTDLNALANFSGGILLEALVLGHSHYKRATVSTDQSLVDALGEEGPLSHWSSEYPVPYESEVNST